MITFHHTVSLDTKLFFGKHKGKTIKQIIESDTGWILWAMQNIEGFMLESEFAFPYLLECEQIEFENRYNIKS